jgi:hypothetical protein
MTDIRRISNIRDFDRMYPTCIRTNIRQITATPQPNPAHDHSPHGQGGKATAQIATLIATAHNAHGHNPPGHAHARTSKALKAGNFRSSARKVVRVRPQRQLLGCQYPTTNLFWWKFCEIKLALKNGVKVPISL